MSRYVVLGTLCAGAAIVGGFFGALAYLGAMESRYWGAK